MNKADLKKTVLLWLEELQSALEFYREKERAGQMAAYLKNKFEFMGLPQPLRKKLSAESIKASKSFEMVMILDMASALWKLPEREYQYIAMEMLYVNRKKWDASCGQFFMDLISSKPWWDTVDFIASRLIGEWLLKERNWSAMKKWMHSDDLWQNRVALIFQLNYKSNTDSEFLFDAVRTLEHKKDFFIQKAIGWSLRQYYRTDPAAVEEFVAGRKLSPLALREALKHAL